MSNSTVPPSIAPEPLEARRLLSAALSSPASPLSPRVTPAQAAPTAATPAASNAEDGAGETDAPGESDDAAESAATSQPQQQQGAGETTDQNPTSDGEAPSPATTPQGTAEDVTPTPPATESDQPSAPARANPTPGPAATTPVSPAVEPPTPSAAPVQPPDRLNNFDAPVLLASQAAPSVRSAPFAIAGELPVSELAHTVFSTRTLLALGEIERAGVAAIPAMVRTLIGASGPSTVPLPGASPSPAAPNLADMADLAARTMTTLGRPDALAAFADAIASFAHESAAPGTLAAAANLLADAPATHARAWAVSAAVVTADAILVGQWYGARRRDRRRQQEQHRTPSPFAPDKP